MRQTEIHFNKQETDLMFSREIFPLKRQINEKIFILFEQIKQGLKDSPIHRNFIFPEQTDTDAGKISQGENHNQFPWVMLDFPKLFQKNRIFSYRTLFWYGNGFSNSLLIGGECCDKYGEHLIKNKEALHGKEIYFSFAGDPWNHEVKANESALIETISNQQIEQHLQTNNYFKLSNSIQSHDAEKILTLSLENYFLLLGILK